jgi:hypothetical protein
MTTITRTTVRFSNARAGVSPATYGQRDMWDKLAVMEPHTHVLNILQVAHLPAGLALADVLGAIHDLVLRHEALRTRFRLDADGTLWQELTATGEIPVELGDGAQDEDPELASAAAEHELESTDFDLTRSWPVRLLAGTMGATPIVVMICTSHIAADMLSARLIRQDLIDLCDARIKGEPPPILPARRQPLDQAAFEASPACLRADQQARKSWRRRLESAPRSMFTAHPAAPRSPRFVRVTLSSAALPLAAEVLGARYRVTTAVIILAAQAVLLRHQADTDRCALNINVGNRIAPELAWSAGNIRQHSLAVLDLRGAGFGRIVQRAWSAWLLAQRAGIADPDGLRALRHGLELRRGLVFDISCGFNDLRFVTQPGPGAGAITPQHIAAAAQSTSCAWAEIPAHYGRFTMRVADEPGPRPPGRSSRVRVETCVDTAVLPPDQASALILGMERLLAWLAADEARGAMVLDGATLAEVTGGSRGRSSGRLGPGRRWLGRDRRHGRAAARRGRQHLHRRAGAGAGAAGR